MAIVASLVPFIAAGLIGFLFYQFFRDFEFSVGSSASSRVERFASLDRRGITDKVGDTLVDRLGFSFDAWKHELMWAQLGGYYEGKTAGSVLGQSVLFGGIGIAYILIVHAISPFYIIGI